MNLQFSESTHTNCLDSDRFAQALAQDRVHFGQPAPFACRLNHLYLQVAADKRVRTSACGMALNKTETSYPHVLSSREMRTSASYCTLEIRTAGQDVS